MLKYFFTFLFVVGSSSSFAEITGDCQDSLKPSRPPVVKMAWFAIRNMRVISKIRNLPPEKALIVQALDPYDPESYKTLSKILDISERKAKSYWQGGLEIRKLMESLPEAIKQREIAEQALETARAGGRLTILTSEQEYNQFTDNRESLIFFSSDHCHPCLIATPIFANFALENAAYTKAPSVRSAAFVSIVPQIVYKNSLAEIRVNAAVETTQQMHEILGLILQFKDKARGLNILTKTSQGYSLNPVERSTVNQLLF